MDVKSDVLLHLNSGCTSPAVAAAPTCMPDIEIKKNKIKTENVKEEVVCFVSIVHCALFFEPNKHNILMG